MVKRADSDDEYLNYFTELCNDATVFIKECMKKYKFVEGKYKNIIIPYG